jgi:hypothetical protein
MRRAVLILAITGACGGGRVDGVAAPSSQTAAGESFTGSLSPRPSPEAFAVAEVDGDTIWDVDVARYAREHSVDARTALDELVGLTLLAQEAARRGLADDPEVAEARQRERVRLFIAREFASRFKGPEDVPEEQLQAAWKHRPVYLYFNHELYHRVRYARVPVGSGASEAEWAAARLVAEDLRRHLVAARPASKEAFSDALTAWKAEHETQPIEVNDFPASQGDDTAASFRAIAFSLDTVGQISPPGRTEWGWDVLFLYEILAKRSTSFEDAKPELRQKLFDSSQQQGFLDWVAGLARAHKVVVRPELVEQVVVQSAAGAAAEAP